MIATARRTHLAGLIAPAVTVFGSSKSEVSAHLAGPLLGLEPTEERTRDGRGPLPLRLFSSLAVSRKRRGFTCMPTIELGSKIAAMEMHARQSLTAGTTFSFSSLGSSFSFSFSSFSFSPSEAFAMAQYRDGLHKNRAREDSENEQSQPWRPQRPSWPASPPPRRPSGGSSRPPRLYAQNLKLSDSTKAKDT